MTVQTENRRSYKEKLFSPHCRHLFQDVTQRQSIFASSHEEGYAIITSLCHTQQPLISLTCQSLPELVRKLQQPRHPSNREGRIKRWRLSRQRQTEEKPKNRKRNRRQTMKRTRQT